MMRKKEKEAAEVQKTTTKTETDRQTEQTSPGDTYLAIKPVIYAPTTATFPQGPSPVATRWSQGAVPFFVPLFDV